jgi:hypothetical protein
MPKRGMAARIDASAAGRKRSTLCCARMRLAGMLFVVAGLTHGILLAQWQVNPGGFRRPGAASMRYGGYYGARNPALPSQNRFARQADGLLPSQNRALYLAHGPLPSASGYTQWARAPGSIRYSTYRPVHSTQYPEALLPLTAAPRVSPAPRLVRPTSPPVGSAFPGRIEPQNVFAAPTQTGSLRSLLPRAGSVSRTRPLTPTSIRYAEQMAGRQPSVTRPVPPSQSILTSTGRPSNPFSPRPPTGSIRYAGR